MNTTRRGLLLGAASLLAAPAIVRAEFIMPVRRIIVPTSAWLVCDGRALSRHIYPELYRVLGQTYGGNGDTFRIPLLPVRDGIRSEIRTEKSDAPWMPVGIILNIMGSTS